MKRFLAFVFLFALLVFPAMAQVQGPALRSMSGIGTNTSFLGPTTIGGLLLATNTVGNGGTNHFVGTLNSGTNISSQGIFHGDGSGLTNVPFSTEVNVSDFGTYADYFQSTGSMAASSLLLTGTVSFVSADIGKIVAVFGAGPSTSDLVTTIASVSSGVATLALASSVAVTNTATSYGHNDATNIQAAIAYAESIGGGTVIIPEGKYLLIPTNWSTAVSAAAVADTLIVRSNNIIIRGAGPYRSVLCNLGAYRLISGAVQRSYGLRLAGTSDAQPGVVEIRDLGLYGGLNGFTGNGAFPADPADGDGWDVTHKGLILGTTLSVDRVLIADYHSYGWRGETIYANTDLHTSVWVDKSVLEDSNGNLLNPSSSVRVRDTVFLNAINGVEMTQGVSHEGSSFVNCTFSNLSGGININGGLSNAIHPVLISGNYFAFCTNGIAMDVAQHVAINDNVFSDTTYPIRAGNSGGGGNWDLQVAGNSFLSRTYNCVAITLLGGVYNLTIAGNEFLQGSGTTMYAGQYYGDMENVWFTGNTMHCTRAFIPAAAVTGHRPLFDGNVYDVSDKSEIDQSVGAGPITVTYTGEVKGLQSSTDALHDVLITTSLVTDGATMILQDASSRTTAALVWRVTNSATVKVAGTRYLRLSGDQLKMRFNAGLGVWEEQSYVNPLWAYSLTAPTVGVWDVGERIFSGTNDWLVCVVAGTPGTWVRYSYIESTNGVGTATTLRNAALTDYFTNSAEGFAINSAPVANYDLTLEDGLYVRPNAFGTAIDASGGSVFGNRFQAGAGETIGDAAYWSMYGEALRSLVIQGFGATSLTNLANGINQSTNVRIAFVAGNPPLVLIQNATNGPANLGVTGYAALTNGVLWQGGAQLTNIYTATATLDFGNVATIGCGDLTITVTGAALGDVVDLGVPNASVVANSSYSAWVSAADTVTVRFCALISGDPASGVFRAEVHKWK